MASFSFFDVHLCVHGIKMKSKHLQGFAKIRDLHILVGMKNNRILNNRNQHNKLSGYTNC